MPRMTGAGQHHPAQRIRAEIIHHLFRVFVIFEAFAVF
jgi:hypothetical protein